VLAYFVSAKAGKPGLAPLADIIRLVYFHNPMHIREMRQSMDVENGRLEDA